MKRVFSLLLVLATALTASAQSDIDNIIKGSAADANYLVKGYTAPALNSLGFGLNQGWYNTAANHKLGGFDMSVDRYPCLIQKWWEHFLLPPQALA